MNQIKDYLSKRMKDLGKMLQDYEERRDSFEPNESDKTYFDKLVLVGRARIEELERLNKWLKKL